ncbi:molybdate ABC transporter substrate-binding protein [Pectinatus haikarae]|uniref:Molybdate transport system substrate-binding protein n=1 Tax=Pectinatus haikarae TaxID=349096 RepID=A0ABT9Y5L7_9FIRM|nr:molybdate ABC transporter substrate-binding protein [Pectinatus haikarae]MDQ0202933.1 molybdate transport system substrate-binding protein [Pectinatus haikarae]
MKRCKNIMVTLLFAMLTAAVLTAGCGQQNEEKNESSAKAAEQQKIVVSAAASLKETMNSLAEEYKKKQPNTELTFNFGASGSLQSQIEQGAPADVFISAAQKQMDTLDSKGLLADGTRKDLLINKIVLITPKDNKNDIKQFSDIITDKAKKIAIGDPKSVPAGQYAEEVFKNLKYEDAVTPKAVYGNDVRAVLAWVENGEADCGLVYKTDAAISDKVNIVAEAPDGSHKPIIYPVAILKSTKSMDAAKDFVAFLQTPEAAKIFEKYGFTMAK